MCEFSLVCVSLSSLLCHCSLCHWVLAGVVGGVVDGIVVVLLLVVVVVNLSTRDTCTLALITRYCSCFVAVLLASLCVCCVAGLCVCLFVVVVVMYKSVCVYVCKCSSVSMLVCFPLRDDA